MVSVTDRESAMAYIKKNELSKVFCGVSEAKKKGAGGAEYDWGQSVCGCSGEEDQLQLLKSSDSLTDNRGQVIAIAKKQ